MNENDSPAKYGLIILAIVTVLMMVIISVFGWPGDRIYSSIGKFCADVPYLIGMATLLTLWALYSWMSKTWGPLEIIRGADQRWSTSKLQFFLWTIVALFSYASIYAARIGARHLEPLDVPANLLLAMGFSATTAVAAKGITVSQINGGASRQPADNPDLGDLVNDDGGAIDLTKVQMLGWTVIAFVLVQRQMERFGVAVTEIGCWI